MSARQELSPGLSRTYVHECGYSGGESDFTGATEVSPLVKEHVLNELAPSGASECRLARQSTKRRPRLLSGRESSRVRSQIFCLRAAWCCVDEGDIEAERYFRRLAAWTFEQALSSYDGVAAEERAVLTYLVGELWRRIGDFDRQETGLIVYRTK